MKKKRYIEYDLDETFDRSINTDDEKLIQKLLETGKVKCAYATKTIISGRQVEVEIYPEFTRRQQKHDSTIKKKTSDQQKKLNTKNARKKLERLMNVNFADGDIWSTLTYDKQHLPKSMNEALKNMRNYIRRINYKRKKKNLPPAKYIYITEWSEDDGIRCHHHLVIDGALDMDTIESTWKCGRRNNTRRISTDDNGVTGLATYIAKDPKGSKRWCGSLNLKKPTIRKNHQDFKSKQIKQMTENKNMIRELIEKKYHGLIYIQESAKYNSHNGRTYFYIRLSKPKEQRCKRE